MTIIENSAASRLEEIIGHRFNNRLLMIEALTHSSYCYENRNHATPDYERLEFLGDAVIGLVLAEVLVRMYPEWSEGRLSRFRHWLYEQKTLALLAATLDIGPHIFLGKALHSPDNRVNESILADVFEALIGAVFMDSGFDRARDVVVSLFSEVVRTPYEVVFSRDPKSELQETLSARSQAPPEYRLAEESGPPHDRQFRYLVLIDGRVAGEGQGRSKKIAQQLAAGRALEQLVGSEGEEA